MSGESWFGLPYTWRPEPSWTSQPQPEPNWFVAAAVSLSLKSPNEPNAEAIASPSAPEGSPPPFGPMTFQKSEWFAWPPALLRTGPCLSDGSEDRLARTSSTDLSAQSVSFSAPLARSTYVA